MDTRSPIKHFSETIADDRLAYIERAFILFVRGLFRTRPLGYHRWSPNEDESEIFIAGGEPEQGSSGFNVPRIIIKHGPASFVGTSTSQSLNHGFGGQAPEYLDLVGTSISMRFSAKEGLEAGRLAYTVFRMILPFRKQLAQVGAFHHLNTSRMQLSAETPRNAGPIRSSNPEYKTSTLMVPVHFHEHVRADNRAFYAEVTNFMAGAGTADGAVQQQVNDDS